MAVVLSSVLPKIAAKCNQETQAESSTHGACNDGILLECGIWRVSGGREFNHAEHASQTILREVGCRHSHGSGTVCT